MEVRSEFEEHWGPGAPWELRYVLAQLIGCLAEEQLWADPELELEPMEQLLDSTHELAVHAVTEPRDSEVVSFSEQGLQHLLGLFESILKSQDVQAYKWGGWLLGERPRSLECHRTFSRSNAVVDQLLRLPFVHALGASSALRAHIASHEHPKELDREFRAHWGPLAPDELRWVLEQIISAEATGHSTAADEGGDTAADEGGEDFLWRRRGVVECPPRPRARL